MDVLLRRPQLAVDAVEAQLHVGLGEAERVRRVDGLAVLDPLVHAPEVGVALRQVQSDGVDDPRDQRQLLGRPDRSADAGRIVGRALPPGFDVFERLGEIELLERVVEVNGEARPR